MPQECAGQSLQHTAFTQHIIFRKSGGRISLTSYLGFRQKYLEVQQTPFVWVQHSSAEGKQAVLLESLFKESASRRVPPLSAPANRESALSPTKTSQPRPFLHTRQKNAQGCSLLLPQTLLWMFGREAEMTGTTIRLPYLEKIAETLRGGSAQRSAVRERVVSIYRAHRKASVCC